jgi:basic membrane protein A and related proteins
MKNTIKTILLVSLLTVSGAVSLASCDSASSNGKIKVGLIALHDSNSTYDKNFIDAFNAACDAKGVTAVIRTGVPESSKVTEEADDLVDQGCKFIFADSFGHESHLLASAKKAPDVQFSHATGTMAHTEKVSNFHNAFSSIYEGRYLAGVAAGLKLQEMINENPSTSKKIGYVGAYPYAEVVSGYTSYYLGVKSIVSDVTMEVSYTNSWYDEAAEKNAAKSLIDRGCSVISQHADSLGAPTACEEAKVPNISYNGSTESAGPNTYIISSKINWQPYFELCIDAVINGTSIPTDYTGTLGDDIYSGSTCLVAPGAKAAAGTEAKLKEVHKQLKDGTLKVFDCASFTVNGEHLTSYKADVDTDANYTKDTEVIKTENGITYFAESEFRSAPYFDVRIDGITELTSGN